jgi:hypothetical protein
MAERKVCVFAGGKGGIESRRLLMRAEVAAFQGEGGRSQSRVVRRRCYRSGGTGCFVAEIR